MDALDCIRTNNKVDYYNYFYNKKNNNNNHNTKNNNKTKIHKSHDNNEET